MDDLTRGAWLIHHTTKLSLVQTHGEYGATRLAGKAGRLLSCVSAENQRTLTNDQVTALAKAADIDPTFELDKILSELEQYQLVDRGDSGLEVLGLTNGGILSNTDKIFQRHADNRVEPAALDLAEQASHKPWRDADLREFVADLGELDAQSLDKLFDDAEKIGFTDYEELDGDTKVYFNGNLFRRGQGRKMAAVLDSLQPREQTAIIEMQECLRENACVTEETVKGILGKSLFYRLQAIGMYDVSEVKNAKESVRYVTEPAAFSKFGGADLWDAFDHAKALVASLRYGMDRRSSSRGRIMDVGLLLKKLVRGDWVGPATAIGQDYQILELAGVVELQQTSGQLFRMRLLKPEVGTIALQVIERGTSVSESLPNFPTAAVSQFRNPETNRMLTRKRQRELGQTQLADSLEALRTGAYRTE